MKTSILILFTHLLVYSLLFSSACNPSPTSQPINPRNNMISTPILTGDTITISAVSGHTIGHGQFHIKNPNTKKIEVQILQAQLIVGDSQRSLTPLYLTLEEAEESIPAEKFILEEGADLEFTISFPAVESNPYSQEPHSIQLTVVVDDKELSASSIINLERRIPR